MTKPWIIEATYFLKLQCNDSLSEGRVHGRSKQGSVLTYVRAEQKTGAQHIFQMDITYSQIQHLQATNYSTKYDIFFLISDTMLSHFRARSKLIFFLYLTFSHPTF